MKNYKFNILKYILVFLIFQLCLNIGCNKTQLVENQGKSLQTSAYTTAQETKTIQETDKIQETKTTSTATEGTTTEGTTNNVNNTKKTEEEMQVKMKIESPSFKNNDTIPSKYTCDGEDINPPLKIAGVPKNTVSLVLIVEDPDAPGKTWVHWTVWNIDPKTTEIAENSVPVGAIQGITDFGFAGYGGPCPPSGTHRYFFKLYAIDSLINLSSSATAKDIQKAIEGHILDSAELVGLYSRK